MQGYTFVHTHLFFCTEAADHSVGQFVRMVLASVMTNVTWEGLTTAGKPNSVVRVHFSNSKR